jgi:hypothetical protein
MEIYSWKHRLQEYDNLLMYNIILRIKQKSMKLGAYWYLVEYSWRYFIEGCIGFVWWMHGCQNRHGVAIIVC